MGWDAVLDQDMPKRFLQAHVRAQRVAGAYLLVGPEGIGKRRLAMEMAKALNCQSSAGCPCDACPACLQIAKQTHPDVHWLSPSGPAEQVKIGAVRHVLSRLALRPFNARFQVVIIDGAQRLTEEAANSLLKTLEEPPAQARFLLTASQPAGCLPTIVSRCQLVRCRRLSTAAVESILASHSLSSSVGPADRSAVCRLAAGSAGEAVALASRWPAYQGWLDRLRRVEPSAWLDAALPETRQDVQHLLEAMIAWVRDVAVAAGGGLHLAAHQAQEGALRAQARVIDIDQCLDGVLQLIRLRESLDQFISPRLVASLARETWLSMT